MRILKGCLVTILLFIIICLIGFSLYKSSVISHLESSSKNVENNWDKYIGIINQRNKSLFEKNIKSDSLLYFLKSSQKSNKIKFSREFEYFEYKINENLMSQKISNEFSEALNLSISNYNHSVREYNTYRGIFPNFIIAKRAKYPKFFHYFDIIKYGIENQNPIEKRKKVDDWIKNGEEFPK
ncbi:LemA family protein [Flavobacterium sp. SM15]|uniref:LemA family protein n=1 Tax=Flavobacterium sp. SM15 TaxID=2908005 RepID=UPI001EDB37AA|nr:LemA family protein [Flavobacterium sp. SM15]MCG2611995.1 LemA family protein [Flavobacterium sp. SM15]